MGAELIADIANDVPIPATPPNPTLDDILRIVTANQQKFKPLMTAYLMAATAEDPNRERHRDKAHETLDLVFDQLSIFAKKVAEQTK